ncbi:hypothetical protein KEJ26_05380 [Candidatus Bathyarchaeota archaeon]|nr:hypothetical protein [Candidatus Bathyarchaeota archaeon]
MNLPKKLVLYVPHEASSDLSRLRVVETAAKKAAQTLGCPFDGPRESKDHESICVYYYGNLGRKFVYADWLGPQGFLDENAIYRMITSFVLLNEFWA